MPSETVALAELRRLLSYWLEGGRLAETIEIAVKNDRIADLVVQLGDQLLLAVEYKGASDAAAVAAAIAQARRSVEEIQRKLGRHKKVLPLIAVPYMGDVGKRLCEEAKTSWVDLSGNANIDAPVARILVEGKPNKFTRRGRPSTAFGPRSARVARLLLLDPSRSFRQQELARESGLDDGFVSRIVHRLEADDLIVREKTGAVRVRDPNLLLDAWSEVYDFTKHTIIQGHVTSRTGEELLARLGGILNAGKLRYAATGLGAASLYIRFAGFRLVTFFVARPPEEALLRKMGFRPEPKGANVWLVVPNDEGVFVGAAKHHADRITCVHPVQAYLDLRTHPERAKEAAEWLRDTVLRWSR